MNTSSSSATHITVTNPNTGDSLQAVPVTPHDEVVASVVTARETFPVWSSRSADDRGAVLRRVADALASAADELARINHEETGKPVDQAREGVDAGVGTLRQYAELGPLHRGFSLRGDRRAADYTLRRPRGVVVALTPWNDPVAVACGLLGAAVVTGNTVIHKPSERNPFLGHRLGEILTSALPEGVLQTVTGGADTGALLAGDAAVDLIAHVGSTSTGRSVRKAGADTGAHVICENGGNDALIIDSGVDVEWAADQAALGSFTNAGQICTSVERIYVHRSLHTAFLEALTDRAERVNTAADRQPLVDSAHREGVHHHVEDAVNTGAEVLVGGRVPAGPGCFYPATVLSGCTPEMAVMQQESFGPLAPVQEVASLDDGLALAENDSHGLAATVLTPRVNHALSAVADLTVGTVKINDVFGGAPGGSAQPRKASGEGFGFGPELLDEMTTTTVVHVGALPEMSHDAPEERR